MPRRAVVRSPTPEVQLGKLNGLHEVVSFRQNQPFGLARLRRWVITSPSSPKSVPRALLKARLTKIDFHKTQGLENLFEQSEMIGELE